MTADLPLELSEKFEILGVLGEGGMGVVYRAKQRLIERVVALKIMPTHNLTEEYMGRFVQEARLASQLMHSNVVVLFDFGFAGGIPYIVFECVDGPSVRQVLKRGVPPVELALDLVSQCCEGLTAAHGRSIVHRDLKPENLLLSGDGTLKIADFGIAKDQAGQGFETATGVLVGTPPYMAPEQARGSDEIGPGTDIYALGCVLFELLSGNVPFRGKTVLETLQMHAEHSPPALPHVPQGLRTLVTKALAKRPQDRFRSARAFKEELDHVATMLGHEQTIRDHAMTRSFLAEERPRPNGATKSGTMVSSIGEGADMLHRSRREVTPVAPVSRSSSHSSASDALSREPESEGGGGFGVILALVAAMALGAILMSARQGGAVTGGGSGVVSGSTTAGSGHGFGRKLIASGFSAISYQHKADRVRMIVLQPLTVALSGDTAKHIDEYRAEENDPTIARLAGCVGLLVAGLEESARTDLHAVISAPSPDGLDPAGWLLMNTSLELLALQELESTPANIAAAESQESKRGSPLKFLVHGMGALKSNQHDLALKAFLELGAQATGKIVPPAGAWERGGTVDPSEASSAWFFLGLAQLLSSDKAADPQPACRHAAGSLVRYLSGLPELPCGGAARGLLAKLDAGGLTPRGLPPVATGGLESPSGPEIQRLLQAAHKAIDRAAAAKKH